MTPLADLLIARIRATGPINIAEFMSECLLHPKHGYYSTRDPFGQAGDFTTAPEISQMFGELLGLSLAQCWLDQGSPTPFVLAELGPGRGTLMADVMRATQKVTGFHSAAQLHLIEASKHLRKVQRETLAGLQPVWLDHVVKLPDAPLFLLANEFFDALPIRQFTRHTQGWQEHLVTAGDGTLAFALSEPGNIARLEHRLDDTKSGDIVEVCEPAGPIVTEVAAKISEHGGAAIVVDYGGWHSLGDTLQALRNHEYENPLAQPGQADLTAHVDFEALAANAPGVAVTRMTGQGALLEHLGVRERHAALAKALSGEALQNHNAALHRLTAPQEMGTLFKAMALYPVNAPPPPGLEP